MKTTILTLSLSLMALVAAAPAPAPASSDPVQTQPLLHPEVLAACDAAENCETYSTPYGLMIRFKPGMEPGTDDYISRFPSSNTTSTTSNTTALIQRDENGYQSYVTFGSTSINYGTTNPSDALHHCLYTKCHESGCEPTMCTMDTYDLYQSGTSSGPRSRQLDIYASGQYNGWDERNCFVDAVVVAASYGQVWTRHNWCVNVGGRDGGSDCGTQWWGE